MVSKSLLVAGQTRPGHPEETKISTHRSIFRYRAAGSLRITRGLLLDFLTPAQRAESLSPRGLAQNAIRYNLLVYIIYSDVPHPDKSTRFHRRRPCSSSSIIIHKKYSFLTNATNKTNVLASWRKSACPSSFFGAVFDPTQKFSLI